MSAGFHQRYTIRLDCSHLITYAGSPPSTDSLVWCVRCDRGRLVRQHYYDLSRPGTYCLAQRWSEGRDLCCTLERGHRGLEHYDRMLHEPFRTRRLARV